MSYRSCTTCVATDRAGYCAPRRCYCGHQACTAYASYIDMSQRQPIAAAALPSTDHHAKSWADREGETWLDQL